MSIGNLLKNFIKDVNTNNSVNGFFTPAADQTFTSGLNYARSIADGQNVPNMISSGTSYSSAMPQGFTQADINSGAVPNPFAMISDTPPPPPPEKLPGPDEDGYGQGIGGVTIFDDIFDKKRMPPRDLPPGTRSMFGGDPRDLPIPLSSLPRFNQAEMTKNIAKLFDGTFDFNNILNGLNSDIPNVPVDTPPPVGPVDMPGFIEEDFFTPPVTIPEPAMIQGPVDMPMPPLPPIDIEDIIRKPGVTTIEEAMEIPKRNNQLFIDDMPSFNDMPSKEYVVPEVPLNNLLNQNPPQGPVGMSPQETAKMSSQQELLNLIDNKDILQEIPADDGVRNQYQVELDEFINKSPINMDTYKEELPIGSAINLGIPAVMETVVPMAVPGLSLAKNISDSFQNNFSPSPAPSPSPSPAPSVSSFTPGIDYSSIYKFGR